ncbi:hypothetical protein PT974_09093 [Cladobotryum mycophilum]|uniref:Uncharacterized protein n=1 Tax=Cladobotryum mycophilum TaxID=491253 RepID=A0ABR0SFB1_9HYPO
MITRRRRSVPPPGPPSSDQIQGGVGGREVVTTIATIPSPSSLPATQPLPNLNLERPSKPPSKLLTHADALARMTLELNLRAVTTQADRLEKDLKALVLCTAQDKAFRESHESRLQDMWHEILAVKNRMSGFQEESKEDYERCQRDMSHSIEQVREEMSQLKSLVDDVTATLDRLPTVAEADSQLESLQTQTTVSTSDLQGKTQPRMYYQERRFALWLSAQRTDCVKAADQSPQATIKRRIREALNSTRRWNRDHKTTALSDAAFTANYLKQQSKRDPIMAVFIQRAIQRRIQRSRRPRTKTRPQNLEQFCQDVTWTDVIETVEEALVGDQVRAVKALR